MTAVISLNIMYQAGLTTNNSSEYMYDRKRLRVIKK
jgi:hypothetical protein